MKSVSEYGGSLSNISLDEFLEGHPPAVFLHHREDDPLHPVQGVPRETIFRLALDRRSTPGVATQVPNGTSYEVLPIMSRGSTENRRYLIGCAGTCDLVLNDRSISRAHAWIERHGTHYLLRDNASTGGTRINDQLLDPGQTEPLRSGDRVSLGAVDITFLEPREFFLFVCQMART